MNQPTTIDQEYEQLFGKAKQVQLLDYGIEEYEMFKETVLQQQILPRRLQLRLKSGDVFDNISIVSNEKERALRALFSALYNIKQPWRKPKKTTIRPSKANLKAKPLIKSETQPKKRRRLVGEKNTSVPTFFIKVEGKCSASGFYNETDNHFYIKQKSLVSNTFDTLLGDSPIQPVWKKFIDNDCSQFGSYCVVEHDVKFPKASLAATFVLGRAANNAYWRDENGLFLKDYYPERFAYTYM